MTNTAKKAKEATAETATTAEVKTTMTVVKPEPQQPETPTPQNIEAVKGQICDRYNLVEKHEVLSSQLADLKNFEATISHDAGVRIQNGSGRSFNSADPQAVKRMIKFCRESIESQISEIEILLLS